MKRDIALPDYRIFELSPIGMDYYLLIDEGWKPAQALFMAWKAHQRPIRKLSGLPLTQIEFAKKVLLLKGDSAFRRWRSKNPEIDKRIKKLGGPKHILKHYTPRALVAMGEVAIIADPKAHPDRKLLFEMAGLYTPKSKQELTGPDGKEFTIKYVNDWRSGGDSEEG